MNDDPIFQNCPVNNSPDFKQCQMCEHSGELMVLQNKPLD